MGKGSELIGSLKKNYREGAGSGLKNNMVPEPKTALALH
jgi:hypothetical protein